MKTAILTTFLLFVGCTGNEIVVRGPDGPRPQPKNTGEHKLAPFGVPTIDLTQDNVATHWTATPTIIDTLSFPNQYQSSSSKSH